MEPTLTANWTYDTAPKGIGKLATATTNNGYSRTHTYDALGRPDQTTLTIDAVAYSYRTTYDAAGRIDQIAYPSGFTAAYSYNALGYQTQLTNAATSEVYWTANARDAELRLTEQTAGNGVTTTQNFDPLMGRLTATQSGAGGTVQNFAYGYDAIGNVTSREDRVNSWTESFTYDNLNRLKTATIGVDISKSFSYDPIGNLLSKSDVGNYAYPAPGQPFPHAVSSISGSVVNTTFSYDANGNMTSGNGLAISYTAFNKPESITRGSNQIVFVHDSEHGRIKQAGATGETLYLNGAGVMSERLNGSGGTTQWTDYLFAGGEMIGMRVEDAENTVYTRYFHKDHLGSITAITDEAGAVVERLSYDAWGKRRNIDGTDDPAGSLASQTTRGFTGHEQLTEVGLVHMNGRVYDPLIGRFGAPDPMTESPYSTQGWNRYAYVGNSPLNFADPSGYCFLGCFWQKPFKWLGGVLRRTPILGNILTVAAGAICGPVCSTLASAAVAGLASGDLGAALKAGIISAVTAVAFNVVGDITSGLPGGGVLPNGTHAPIESFTTAHAVNIIGQAAIGCLSSVASGSKCGPGALAGATGSFFGPMTRKLGFVGGLMERSVIGGLSSVAGGGKFGNGAVTAAFGYLFNDFAKCLNMTLNGCALGAIVGGTYGAGGGCVSTGPACPVGGLGGAVVGGLGGCASGAVGGAIANCSISDILSSQSNPDRPSDRALKHQCIGECNWILEQPDYRGDNEWEFHKCVNDCIKNKKEYWGG